MAREGKYQHLIIESTGVSDPTPVAEALAKSASSTNSDGGDGISVEASRDTVGATAETGGGGGGGGGGELVDIGGTRIVGGGGEGGRGEGMFAVDTLVTVVDSTSFLDEVRKADYLEERGLEAGEEDTRTIADLLVSQASIDARYELFLFVRHGLCLWVWCINLSKTYLLNRFSGCISRSTCN